MSDNASITITRKRGYTLVYNDLLPTDGSLSARAWGLYVYLLSRPDGWECRAGHLKSVFSEGRDAIYTALRELVTAGLMTKVDYIDGGLRRTRYALDADGATASNRRSTPETDSQDPDSPEPGEPKPGRPETASPGPEKAGEASKDSTSTDEASKESAKTTAAAVEAMMARPELVKVCDHLAARLRERDVRVVDPHSKTWLDAARLLIDLDKRTEAQVHNMIEWSQADEFWRGVIHSMPNLRDKYDRMRDVALRATSRPITNRHQSSDSAANARMVAAFDGPPRSTA